MSKSFSRALPGSVVAGLLLSTLANPAHAQTPAPSIARFAWVSYEGKDGPPAPAGMYRNPILAGYYPDPAILRDGADYYLVNSTFTHFPGLPIFHSRDLVNWRQVANAIDRPTQFDFSGLAVSRGIFAPDLSVHKGRYYMVGTCVDCGGNFVMTASSPAGPWSDPTWLKSVEGIDPSLFFDDDGRAWLVNNREPEGGSKYSGHRAIWIEQFDPVALKMMGNPGQIVNGGIDISKKPVWIEGPHIYKVDGKYYLCAAEGGTSVNHSQVILRADTVEGPYVPAPADVNPILTQRDLDSDRPKPITSAGHADLVQLPNGKWWAVFLATRPYRDNLYNIGRETFLLPVSWPKGGWPVILAKNTPIPTYVKRPLPVGKPAFPMTGSLSWRDEFVESKLARSWLTLRAAPVTVSGGDLRLDARRDGLGDLGKPAFAGRRQQHDVSTTTTQLRFAPQEGESAGLAAIQNDDYFLTVALTRRDGKLLVRVSRRAGKDDPREGVTVADHPASANPLALRIRTHGGRYSFDMRQGAQWVTVAKDVDATNLSTDKAGGFVGTLIGPFAQGIRQ